MLHYLNINLARSVQELGKNLALNYPRTCNVCTVMQACYQSEMNGSIVKGINRLTLFWSKILVFIGDLMVASVM